MEFFSLLQNFSSCYLLLFGSTSHRTGDAMICDFGWICRIMGISVCIAIKNMICFEVLRIYLTTKQCQSVKVGLTLKLLQFSTSLHLWFSVVSSICFLSWSSGPWKQSILLIGVYTRHILPKFAELIAFSTYLKSLVVAESGISATLLALKTSSLSF